MGFLRGLGYGLGIILGVALGLWILTKLGVIPNFAEIFKNFKL